MKRVFSNNSSTSLKMKEAFVMNISSQIRYLCIRLSTQLLPQTKERRKPTQSWKELRVADGCVRTEINWRLWRELMRKKARMVLGRERNRLKSRGGWASRLNRCTSGVGISYKNAEKLSRESAWGCRAAAMITMSALTTYVNCCRLMFQVKLTKS